MLTGTGTAREQWAEAGIEVALGRLSAAELHAIGERILRGERVEENREIKSLKRQAWALEDALSIANSDIDHEQSKRFGAERKLEAATAENDDLHKRIAELERTIRGLQQGEGNRT